MEVVGATASIVALVEISVKVLSLTVDYSTQVKSAKEDIDRFRLELEDFVKVLRGLHELAKATKLGTLKSLDESIRKCELDLEHMQRKLEPGKGRSAMSRYGVRALKWPFQKKELQNAIDVLERYKSTFSTALNVDQTALILESGVKMDLAEQDRCLSKLSYAAGASFDSNEREHEHFCLPDTRVEILSQIMKWSADPCHKSIFWLNGMAGTGKSTIARTIARSLTKQKRLGANFFFSRGRGDLSHAGKLLSTIATQLAATSPMLKHFICEAIAENDNIGRQSMRDQWTKLICQPISRLGSDNPHSSLILVFVFDALDECGRQEDIRRLLQLLTETKLSVQFRVLVTSRPEIPIELGFRAIPGNTHEDFVLHNIAPPVIQHDIAVFLRHEINDIRDEFLLQTDWPGKEKLELLVERSSGLFIYAATVCRFIRDPRWRPVKRLDVVLKGNSNEQLPEQRLDEMYIQILESSVHGDCTRQKERDLLSRQFRDTVGLIMVLFDSVSATVLTSLFPTLSETIDTTLRPLKSLLDVPDDPYTPIRLLHPSFRDFLIDQERCRARHFWIDQNKAHHDVAEQCLHFMSKALRRNICQLKTPGTRRREIEETVLNKHVPFQLQYACQYWVRHLQKGIHSVDDVIVARVHEFLQTHFLHWLEALSLMGKSSESVHLIMLLESIPELRANVDLVAFMKDAKRFILEFRYIAEAAPLQLYNSALIFSPQTSVVKRKFSNQMPGWIRYLPRVEENWTSSLQTLEGHSESVGTVVFSPDGQLLASGSFDNTVRLWDPVTGESRGTLEGHSSGVSQVAFSPDGRLLASGSYDNTVRLWDPVTGESRGTLEGHSSTVATVVFSPDSRLLASGSYDNTVRLWDPVTGESRCTLEGHSGWVHTVAFSPDGRLMASGSSDKTVRLWDPVTGDSRGTLEGHSGPVTTVVFSPDGRLLASGSTDSTVRLWDPATGESRGTLEGHSDTVSQVAFSPDGRLLASGSYDNTVRLWDPATGESRGTLEGHSNLVSQVAFSPDGRLLASGSYDNTVRLWDPATGESRGTLEGHSGWVHTVAFSPDGRLMASGSYDNTIRLWDPVTGDSRGILEGHSSAVETVVFSPDGRLLASGSSDKTVRLWDPVTGESRGTLEGHSDKVSQLAFSPDGRLLASGSYDSTVRLWDPATGEARGTLEGHSGTVSQVAFSPDGRLLASGSYDKTVRLWDPVTGELRGTLEGHSNPVTTFVFSPDGRLLASGSSDKTVRLWDPVTGESRGTLEGHSDKVSQLAFSPDGRLMASGSYDDTVRLWDPVTGESRGTLEGHSHSVSQLAFSPDCRLLASGSYDDTVRLWLVEKKTLLQRIEHRHGGNISFSSDGSQLILDGRRIEILSASLTASPQKQTSADRFYTLSVDGQWVTWNNCDVLWLPSNRRAGKAAREGQTIAIGNGSGRMTILSFSTKVFPF